MQRSHPSIVWVSALAFGCTRASDDAGGSSAGPGGNAELAVVTGRFSYYDQQYGCDDEVTFTGVQVGGLRHTLTADITLSHDDADDDRCASAPWTNAMTGRLEVLGVEVTYEGRTVGDVTSVWYESASSTLDPVHLGVSDVSRSVSVGGIAFYPVGRYEL
jgi:hypothetical protein